MAPVVTAALGALGPLLVKLTSLLADERDRLKGVRREIRSLRSELTSMHAALQSYSMLEDPSVQVKAWISLVRELAYDTEDCIDKFIHHLGHGGRQSGIKEFFCSTVRRLKTLRSRRRIASQIGDLKARVVEVQEQKNRYKLDDSPRSTSDHVALDPRMTALFAEEAHLVGIEGPRDELAKWMVDGENSLTENHRRVLSIVGFGGLGKTTLVNEVYRIIEGHFGCRAFVSVSQKPDTTKIFKDIISQVISQVSCHDEFTKDIDTWDEKKSIAKLRELLQVKR
jgi:disease resistance protein RPM1